MTRSVIISELYLMFYLCAYSQWIVFIDGIVGSLLLSLDS